jgi:hypothetical protein
MGLEILLRDHDADLRTRRASRTTSRPSRSSRQVQTPSRRRVPPLTGSDMLLRGPYTLGRCTTARLPQRMGRTGTDGSGGLMNEWLKRLRGIIGMGLTWAVGWVVIGAVLAMVLSVVGLDPPGLFWTITEVFGSVGFLTGSMFSGVLMLAEGRRRFDALSLPRFVAWGALGGLLLGGLAGLTVFGGPWVAGVTTLLAAGSAAATLVIGRRAEDEALVGAGADAAEDALADTESKHLLGNRR